MKTTALSFIRRLSLLIALFFISNAAFAVPNAMINQVNALKSLGQHMEFAVDTKGTMRLEDVQALPTIENSHDSKKSSSSHWEAVLADNIIGGFTESVYWVRFTVENTRSDPLPWVLEVDYPILDFIELYTPILSDEALPAYEKTRAGDQLPFNERPIKYRNITFPITSLAHSTQTYYMRFETESSMYIALNIWPGNSFSESIEGKLVTFGFLYGIVFLATLYCLINAVFLRVRMYLFIAISIFGSLSYSMSINGFAFQYIWPESLWLQSVSIPFFLNLCFGFALFYSREFLDLENSSPFTDKIIFIFASICLALAASSLVLSYSSVIRISTIFAIVTALAAFWAGMVSFYHGNKSARFYLIGWMALIVGAVTFALKSLGVLPSNLFTVWGQEFGFAGIAIFLTLAQSDHFFQAQRKHEAQRSASLKATKDAEMKYRSLFENAIEGIFQMSLDGKLVNANKAYANILGYQDVTALFAQSHPAFSLNCLLENGRNKFKTQLAHEDSALTFETSIPLAAGETRWISISIQQIHDHLGQVSHYEGAMANITESKKRQNAEKQQRMAEASTEAKSLFLANMSHEIRTPMNAIIGFTDLAIGRNTDHQQAGFLKKIRMASTNLLGIINDILDFSKIEAGKLEIENIAFSLKDVLSNLNNIVAANIEAKNIKFNLIVDKDIPDQLIGDPLRIGQVLLNLCNNAIKFTSEGKVEVELELVSLNKRDMSINLCGRITDTGIGIAPEKLKNLFSSFTQADDSTTRRFGGTGLGLSISKQLVEMMGGELSVESIVDQGSVFSFSLAGKIQDRRKRHNPHFTNHLLPLNILVVDDQQDARELFEKTLVALSHNVTCLSDSQETLKEMLAKQNEGNPYDVLITDWIMPDVDGISCCIQVQEHPEIIRPKLILVTGYDQGETKKQAEAAGIDKYMIKPIKENDLSKVLHGLFENRRENPPKQLPLNTVENFDFEGLKALIVEDVAMNQELAIEILSKKGIEASLANNGQEGVDAVRTNTFDLVLMDMQMPVMDGCQATVEIRKFNQQLPIIAMTANAMTVDKNKCLAAGMNGYVTKPINPEVLFNTILRWLKPAAIRLQTDLDEVTEPVAISIDTPISTTSHKSSDIKASADRKPDTDKKIEQLNTQTSHILAAHALPERLPGIELGEGLRRCQDNFDLYLRFFSDFKNTYGSCNSSLRTYAEAEDFEALKSLAHTIKGLAGNLAAKPLSTIAADLEKSDTLSEQGLTLALKEFDKQLKIFLASIEQLLSTASVTKEKTEENSKENTEQSAKTTATQTEEGQDSAQYQASQLLERLDELSPLIQRQSMDAYDLAVDYLKQWPDKAHKERLKSIIASLDSFDFKQAEQALEQLKVNLGD